MADFGNKRDVVARPPLAAVEGTIRGSIFTIPQDGVGESISGWIWVTDEPTRYKCAIYRASDLRLIGVTEQRTISRTDGGVWGVWATFNFSEPKPFLYAGTAYILVAWAESVAYSAAYLAYDPGPGIPGREQGRYQLMAYDGFPDPLSPGVEDTISLIYCTYTPTAPPPKGTLEVHAYIP